MGPQRPLAYRHQPRKARGDRDQRRPLCPRRNHPMVLPGSHQRAETPMVAQPSSPPRRAASKSPRRQQQKRCSWQQRQHQSETAQPHTRPSDRKEQPTTGLAARYVRHGNGTRIEVPQHRRTGRPVAVRQGRAVGGWRAVILALAGRRCADKAAPGRHADGRAIGTGRPLTPLPPSFMANAGE